MVKRYNQFNDFLKEKFGERTLKVCIDGGFTYPNRDGKCGGFVAPIIIFIVSFIVYELIFLLLKFIEFKKSKRWRFNT